MNENKKDEMEEIKELLSKFVEEEEDHPVTIKNYGQMIDLSIWPYRFKTLPRPFFEIIQNYYIKKGYNAYFGFHNGPTYECDIPNGLRVEEEKKLIVFSLDELLNGGYKIGIIKSIHDKR